MGDAELVWRDKVDARLGHLEDGLNRLWNEVHAIKGAMDWIKVAFAFMGAVMIGGFAFLGSQTSLIRSEMREDRIAASTAVAAQITAIKADTSAQIIAIKADTSAQIIAIANVIAAVKQQAPQVILVPAPTAK